MDRHKLKSYFSLNESIPWGCPTCKTGSLVIDNTSFYKEITPESHAICDHYKQWIPEEISYRYSCLFKCRTCNEVIASSGVGFIDTIGYEVDDDGCHDAIYGDRFKPKYFEPALILLSIPDKCPESIQEPLKESFKLFFSSLSASANNARIAIEALLTELNVPKEKLGKKGGLTFMPLHERIGKIPQAYIHVKDMLEAVKWIGNAGSHHGDVKPQEDDVIDIYELIEHVLEEVYEPRLSRLTTIAQRINASKGPTK